MANEFRKVTDQNGVDHPVTDDARVTWAANSVLGAKNEAPAYTLANGTVINGVTVTYDSKGIVNLNGTAGADSYIGLRPRNTGVTLPAETKWRVSGKANANCFTFLLASDGSTLASSADANDTFDYTSATANFGLIIFVKSGTVLSNQKIYPMVYLAADTDPTFAPYAMTNRELTENKAGAIDLSHSESTTTPSANADRTHLEQIGKLCILSFWINSVTISDTAVLKELLRVDKLPTKAQAVALINTSGNAVLGVLNTDGKLNVQIYSAISNSTIIGQIVYYTN